MAPLPDIVDTVEVAEVVAPVVLDVCGVVSGREVVDVYVT